MLFVVVVVFFVISVLVVVFNLDWELVSFEI